MPYFRKMVLIYGLLMAALAAILAIVYYRQYDSAFRDHTNRLIQEELQSSSRSFNDLQSNMDQINSTLNVDRNTNTFISLTEFDPAVTYQTSQSLKNIMMANPYIYEAALCNTLNQESVCSGADTLDLQEGLRRLDSIRGSGIYTAQLQGTDSGMSVLVFAYPFYALTYNDAPNGIFLVVPTERLLSGIPGFDGNAQQIVTADGTVLLQSAENELFPSDPDYLCQALAAIQAVGQDCGSVELQGSGAAYTCSYYTDASDGLIYLRYTSYTRLLSPLTRTRNLFLMISLLIIAAAAIAQFFVSRKMYQPIREITDELGQSKYRSAGSAGNPAAASPNEFQLIRNVYHNALQEIDNLEKEKAVYILRRRNDLLKNIVLDGTDAGRMAQALADTGCPVQFSGCFLASFLIEDADEGLLLPMVIHDIQQILAETMCPDYQTEIIQTGNTEIVLLISTTANAESTFDQLIQQLEKARDSILSRYTLKLNIGLDGIIESASDVHPVYLRVRELQNNRFVLGENQVICRRRVLDQLDDPLNIPDRLMSDIIRAMLENRGREFREYLDSLITTLKRYSCRTARLLFTRLYIDTLSEMRSHGMNLPTEYLTEDSFSPATLEEGQRYMLALFETCQNRAREIEKLKENKHYSTIKDSEDYVLKHYMEPSLNVDQIAARYGYTANYFARIFKSINGTYINDYIREVRIMKAKEMLQNSSMTISEIAIASGFSTSNYFYSIFKKETGLTPTAYRMSG